MSKPVKVFLCQSGDPNLIACGRPMLYICKAEEVKSIFLIPTGSYKIGKQICCGYEREELIEEAKYKLHGEPVILEMMDL